MESRRGGGGTITKLAASGAEASEKGKQALGQPKPEVRNETRRGCAEGNGNGNGICRAWICLLCRGTSFGTSSPSHKDDPSPAQDHASDKGARRCRSRVQVTLGDLAPYPRQSHGSPKTNDMPRNGPISNCDFNTDQRGKSAVDYCETRREA